MNEAAQRSPSESPAPAGHERTDVIPAVVGLFALGLLLLLATVLYAISGISRWFDVSVQRDQPLTSPLLQEELPPEPRLQADPAAALARWRSDQEKRRSSYEFTEGKTEVIRIPVAQAMEILAHRGFPAPKPAEESSR